MIGSELREDVAGELDIEGEILTVRDLDQCQAKPGVKQWPMKHRDDEQYAEGDPSELAQSGAARFGRRAGRRVGGWLWRRHRVAKVAECYRAARRSNLGMPGVFPLRYADEPAEDFVFMARASTVEGGADLLEILGAL